MTVYRAMNRIAMINLFTNMTQRYKFTSDDLILLCVDFGLRFIPLLSLIKFYTYWLLNVKK